MNNRLYYSILQPVRGFEGGFCPAFFNRIFRMIEEKIEDAISGSLDDLGYEIVRIKYFRSEDRTLQIMIDTKSGGVTVEDCSKASRVISAIMDVEDFISEHYNLEVSSPGINRPLTRLKDFTRFENRKIQLKLKDLHEGSRNFKGTIVETEGNNITMLLEDNNNLEVDFDTIDSAHLI